MIRLGMYSVSYALTSEDCKDRLIKGKGRPNPQSNRTVEYFEPSSI